MPQRPANVLIERWLPYEQIKRVVILKKPKIPSPVIHVPRNLIIQWQAPKPKIITRVVNLGVVRADPIEYLLKYSKQ